MVGSKRVIYPTRHASDLQYFFNMRTLWLSLARNMHTEHIPSPRHATNTAAIFLSHFFFSPKQHKLRL